MSKPDGEGILIKLDKSGEKDLFTYIGSFKKGKFED